MKTLSNKVTATLKEVPAGAKNTYADLIRICVPINSPNGGYNIEEMETVLGIYKATEKVKDKITLEDSHAKYLQEKVKTFKWGIAHQDLIDFSKAIAAL